MAYTDAIDLYCERLSAAPIAEPLNALSNLAFFVVAFCLWRALLRREIAVAADLKALIALIVCIGLGSSAFHVVAQRWAGVLDVLFIALYLHAYCAVFLARCIGWRWRLAWLGAPAFFVFAHGVDRLSGAAFADAVSRGTSGYLPALLALCGFAAWLVMRGDPRARLLGAGALVFVASLGLRALDLPLCARWPIGTHFAWHVLNAIVLALATAALLPQRAPTPRNAEPRTLP